MRILLVEDHPKVASFIVKGLQEEHYAVDHAEHGSEGLHMALTETYDIIILDSMLPGMQGLEILREIRIRDNNVPVMILTAKDSIEDKVEALNVGADDYLTKPFAFAEFLARIRALLRRTTTATLTTSLQVADLTMDLAKHCVTRDGKNIDLTSKEFSTLEYLMRNKGTVVSRTSIIEHVWDQNFDSDTNIVDVYIRYLRKKIDAPFKKTLLNTIRGVGYKIDEPE